MNYELENVNKKIQEEINNCTYLSRLTLAAIHFGNFTPKCETKLKELFARIQKEKNLNIVSNKAQTMHWFDDQAKYHNPVPRKVTQEEAREYFEKNFKGMYGLPGVNYNSDVYYKFTKPNIKFSGYLTDYVNSRNKIVLLRKKKEEIEQRQKEEEAKKQKEERELREKSAATKQVSNFDFKSSLNTHSSSSLNVDSSNIVQTLKNAKNLKGLSSVELLKTTGLGAPNPSGIVLDQYSLGQLVELNAINKDSSLSLSNMMEMAVLTKELMVRYLRCRDRERNNSVLDNLGIKNSLDKYTLKYRDFINKFNKLSSNKQEVLITQAVETGSKKKHDNMFGEMHVEPGLISPESLKTSINNTLEEILVEGNGYSQSDEYQNDLTTADLETATKLMSPEQISRIYLRLFEQAQMIGAKDEYFVKLQKNFTELLFKRSKFAKSNKDYSKPENLEEKQKIYIHIIQKYLHSNVLIEDLKYVDTRYFTMDENIFLQEKVEDTYSNIGKWNGLFKSIKNGKGRSL